MHKTLLVILCGLGLVSCKAKPTLHFSGYTDTLYVYLSAPSTGYLNKKYVERGQVVKRKQWLCRLSQSPDLETYKANYWTMNQAKRLWYDARLPRRRPEILAIDNQIQQTKTSMDKVENHLNRLLKLEKKQFVDADTLDNQSKTLKELSFLEKQYQENLKLAKMGARTQQIKAQYAAFRAAKAKLKESQWYLSHKLIQAPNDGYVYDTFYNQGELVPAQKPVLVMVVPDNNYIEFFVSAKDVTKLTLNMPISYQFYGQSKIYQAAINYISATVEYMPPVLYTPDYQEELVFRVRAKPKDCQNFILGQPVEVWA